MTVIPDPGEHRCANCNKRLQESEVAANWNDEWFACLPCWDKSDMMYLWGWRHWTAIQEGVTEAIWKAAQEAARSGASEAKEVDG